MPPLLKRILLIFALLVAAGLIAFGLYALFRKPIGGGGGGVTTTTGQGGGQLPTSTGRGEQGGGQGELGGGGLPPSQLIPTNLPPTYYQPQAVTKVSTDFSRYSSMSQGGEMRYHNAADGKFYRIGADGTIKEMSDQVFYNVQNITWAKTSDKAVLEYPDGTKTVYNFATKSQVTLPKHWEDFSFSPDSSQLAAKSMALAPENRWLVVSKDDGTGTQLVEPLGDNADRVTMDWSPSGQTVALSQTGEPLGADRREVLFIGLHGENFKSTVVEGLDFQPQWSPTGKQLLYSVDSARSDFKPELWVTNAYGDDIGSNRRLLGLNTWANKCTFGNETTLFCAVPRELPQGAGMSPAIADAVPDDVYKIDLQTGLKTSLPLDKNYTINSVSYDAAHNRLFFTDTHQTGIFQINL